MYVVVFFFMTTQWFLTGELEIGSFLNLLTACTCLSVMGFGIGLTLMSLDHFVPGLLLVSPYINRLLYFTSGIFFTLEAVPAGYRSYVNWNPLLQAVEWARQSYFSNMSGELLNLNLLVSRCRAWRPSASFWSARRDISAKRARPHERALSSCAASARAIPPRRGRIWCSTTSTSR